jgi:hypothetical protein
MSFTIGDPATGLFVLGDVVTTVVGIANPEMPAGTDHDPELAALTRAALLGRLADEGWTLIGYHLPDGGIGRIERAGGTFAFVQET